MKNLNIKKIIQSAALAVVTAGTLLCGALSRPQQAWAATVPSSSLTAVTDGKYVLGTAGFKDPTPVTETGKGTYYQPGSYVYYGTDGSDPILWRVLDNDHDNAGGEGAMFLFSEHVLETIRFSAGGNLDVGGDDDVKYLFDGNSPLLCEDSDSARFEHTYQGSYMDRVLNPMENDTTGFDDDGLSVAEMNAIKAIQMQDPSQSGFGINLWKTDGLFIRRNADDSANEAYTGNALDDDYIFPLSVEELEKYVANYNGAPGLAAEMAQGNYAPAWWLRTAYNNADLDAVGAVDASGNVTYIDADAGQIGGRYGINIDLSKVAYSEMIENNVWRLAVLDPTYGDTTQFTAEVEDVKNGNVTIKYQNAIGRYIPALGDTDGEDEFISVIVKNDATGAVKYYGTVGYAPAAEASGQIISTEHTVTFAVPEGYDETTDTMYVFWERKNNNHRMTSYTSNLVAMPCVHVEKTEATCSSFAFCGICNSYYGDYSDNNHVSTHYEQETAYAAHRLVCDSEDCWTEQYISQSVCHVVANCTEVITPCVCGRSELDSDAHDFDANGICQLNENHYQKPQQDAENVYHIRTIGNLLWLSEQVNAGNSALNAKITARTLNFQVTKDDGKLEIIPFEPIGTAENPYTGTFDGAGVSILNLKITKNDTENVGLFGVTDGATIQNVVLYGPTIAGAANVGGIVGNAMNTVIADCSVIAYYKTNSDGSRGDFVGTVTSNDKENEGAIAGKTDANTTIRFSISYKTETTNKDSKGKTIVLALTGDGNAALTNSFYLAETANDVGGRTEGQFASGALAFVLGEKWGQTINTDAYPTLGGATVYQVLACDGETAWYSNSNIGGSHFYTAEDAEFIWDVENFYNYCQVQTYCFVCGEKNPVLIDCDVTPNYAYWMDAEGRPVRIQYVATAMVGGVQTQAEHILVASPYKIENMTGITPIEKHFDGKLIYAESFVNTRLDPKYYTAYFVNAKGEHLEWICAAGTYDLVIQGNDDGDDYHRSLNAYGNQKVVYEDVVVINPIEIMLEIRGLDKVWDGGKDVYAEYEFDYELADGDRWLNISLSDAPSSDIGVYTVNVIVAYDAMWMDAPTFSEYYEAYDLTNDYRSSITLKYNTTAEVEILPRTHVSIENKNYAVEYTYGDTIPDPKAENFTVDEGSTLTFEWYVANNEGDIDYKIQEKPTYAGKYILRVRGSATENLISGYLDVPVTINQKQISFAFGSPVVYDEETDQYSATLELGETFDYNVIGLVNGDTLESAGIDISVVARYYSGKQLSDADVRGGFPMIVGTFYVTFSAVCQEYFGTSYSYENVHKTVYVTVVAENPAPKSAEHIYDGSAKGVEVVVEYPKSNIEVDYIQSVHYQVRLLDANGNVINNGGNVNGDTFSVQYKDTPEKFSFSYTFKTPGVYTLKVGASDGSENFPYTVYYEKIFTVSFDEIKEIGDYTITVTTGEVVKTATVSVKSPAAELRELRISVKEFSLELTDALEPFKITDVAFVAGYTLKNGHTIESLTYRIRVDSGYAGYLEIVDWVIKDASGTDVSAQYTITTANANPHVVHIYGNPCDATCNYNGCSVTRTPAAHRGGTATCTDRAICEVCGEKYGDYNYNNHISTSQIHVPNVEDLTTHALVHACCGRVIEVEVHAGGTATCTDLALCDLCDFPYGELDPENHSSTDVTYAQREDGAELHNVYHACCDAFDRSEVHSGGTPTCKTQAVCELCGDSYGGLDLDHHVGGVATCTDLAVCELCGEEYGEIDPDHHASEFTTKVPSVTDTSVHEEIRSCCGEVISTEAHSGGEANCATAAICEHCKLEYGAIDPHKHASDQFIYSINSADPSVHDKVHACCGAQSEAEGHSGGTATCSVLAVCDHCKVAYGSYADHVYDNACDPICNTCQKTTRAIAFHADENDDGLCDACGAEVESKPISGGAISGIAVGSVAVAGTGGFSLFWFVIKKKKWADLVRFLIG